jgi:hypothetical protein
MIPSSLTRRAGALLRCSLAGGALLLVAREAGATNIADAWQGTYWGEQSNALVARFGARATVLPSAIDFGDSYTNVVLRNVVIGGVPLIGFFQMDKATGGLKRIQFERQRHGVNPPAFRAVLGALEASYGAPNAQCAVWPGPASGYQAAAERVWRREDVVIRAIFRDTTIEAFEGCLAGDPSTGACGLTGQLLIRVSSPANDGAVCAAPSPVR